MPAPRSSRPLFTAAEAAFLRAVVRMGTVNPFLEDRIAAESEALGHDFQKVGRVMINLGGANENVRRVGARLGPLLGRIAQRLADGAAATAEERTLYQEACYYFLYDTFDVRLGAHRGGSDAPVGFYEAFKKEYTRLLDVARAPESPLPVEHLFACYFQIRRAYEHIYAGLLGSSLPVARLRAAVWETIFTCYLRSYLGGLFARLTDIPTLVTGPTGTGKELVAEAIGYSRYLPFNPETARFSASYDADFHPLNLSALSPQLIESELFGHRLGAFTGAIHEKPGWLELAGEHGTLFLDEIGELDAGLQVKLLRALEKRTFQRLGDTKVRFLLGRIVAATHRDLAEAMAKGTFRSDLYYRLCGHLITTPSLREQLDDAPDDLGNLVRSIALRVAGPRFAEPLADATLRWIATELPPDYPWPGNVRELSQCVRNMMMSRAYRPAVRQAAEAARDDFRRQLESGTLPLAEVVRWYSTVARANAGSLQETARRLGVDRHHVADKIDEALLARLLKERAGKR